MLPLLSRDAANTVASADSGGDLDGDVPHEALDEQLALLLGCCHPALSTESQIALTLRAVAGLSTTQIARAFFVSDATMTRRLTRSKSKISLAKIPFGSPDLDTLSERLPAVCAVIYSIFTEGHASSTATSLVRGDLCDESIWLGELLVELVPDDPEVIGLVALMLLIDARRATRVDGDGVPVLLAEQDRSKWDQAKIARGLAALGRAHALRRGGPFQFQAAVAALHVTAPSFEQTNWTAVRRLYDVMLIDHPTAILALNRSVAVAQTDGPVAGLRAVDAIANAEDLDGDISGYVYFHTARAEFLAELGRLDESRAAFDRAIELSDSAPERTHLERRRSAVLR